MKHYRQPDADRRHFLWTAAAAGAFALSGAQRLAAQDALPTEMLVNTTTVGIQDQATVAPLFASRQFIVIWVNRPDAAVRAQRFREDGLKVGGEFVVNSSMEPNTERLRPIISNKPGGGFLVAWIERAFNPPPGGGALIFRIFDLEGTPQTSEIRPNISGFTVKKR